MSRTHPSEDAVQRAQARTEQRNRQKAEALESLKHLHAAREAEIVKTRKLRAMRLAKEAEQVAAKAEASVKGKTAAKAKPRKTAAQKTAAQ